MHGTTSLKFAIHISFPNKLNVAEAMCLECYCDVPYTEIHGV